MSDAIDTTTLGWIKPELDQTLQQARDEIEAFAENKGDTARMRACAAHLHQVHGTLRMVELYAPAMVAEEMERLSLALLHGEIENRDEACAVLMRGAVQLPDYLERLQGGHRDIPIVLLPLLNELRAMRGEVGLNESVLFAPNLDRPLPSDLPASLPANAKAGSTASAHLAALRKALNDWPEHAGPADPAALVSAIDGLLSDVAVEPLRRMLWVAQCVAEALRDNAMPATRALRHAFGGVEREARQMLEGDDFSGPRSGPAAEPTRQLLYHVAHSAGGHPALDTLRETFNLDAQMPSESEVEHARGSLSGRNRELLDTVSAAIKEDLLRVKDALDLHLRTQQDDVGGLAQQVDVLTRVSDTLGMLGLGMARNVVVQHRDILRDIVNGLKPADEGALLDVAGALLYVDASLDDQVSRLGHQSTEQEGSLLASESRKVLDVVVREAIANFGDARQSFVAFVETNWDHDELAEVPRLLDEVGGAMRILELELPGEYLRGIKRYTEVELIGRRKVPTGSQLDTLADSLASLEYYLEAVREQRPNRERILDIARQSLESLGYWPVPSTADHVVAGDLPGAMRIDDDTREAVSRALGELERAPAHTAGTPGAPAAASGSPDTPAMAPAPADTAAPAEHVAAHSPVADAGVASAGFEHSDDIDDDIREVFLEEVEEEIANLGNLLPTWYEQPGDKEKLRPIRRVFHTLKGSGRLVGARTLGEFSWKIESMLNRVLDTDNGREASPAVVSVVEHAFAVLPQLRDALQGGAVVTADLPGLEAIADRVAAGEEVFYTAPEVPTQAAAAEAPASVPEPPPEIETQPDAVSPVEDVEVEAGEPETTVIDEVAGTEPEHEPAKEPEPAGIPASVDPVLLEILDAEVTGHLATIEDWIASAQVVPQHVNDGLQRAIHTLNGAFAMTEVPVITEITAPAEGYVKRLLVSGAPVNAEGVATLAAVAHAIRSTLEALKTPAPRIPAFEGLADRVVELRDALPAVQAPVGIETIEEPATPALPPAAERERTGHLLSIDLSSFVGHVDAVPSHLGRSPEAIAAELDEVARIEREREERLQSGRMAPPRDAASEDAINREAALLEAERIEAERAEAERLAAERIEAERAEAERLAAERAEAERAEAERLAAERAEAERAEAERLAAERAEAERAEAERLAAERAEAERAEAERLAAERAEAERAEAERLAAERAEAERAEAERLAAERAEAERAEAERLAAERAEAERAEAERLATERAEAERVEAERLATEHAEAERVEAERLAAERAEAERLEAERVQAEEEAEYARLEAEYAASERAAEGAEDTDGPEIEDVADAAPADVEQASEPALGHAILAAITVEADPDADLDLTDLDPELVDIFVEEGGDLLDHSDGLLAQLRQSPEDRDILVGMQRDLHTLKGGARMAGIMAVGELGHVMESLLEAVVERRVELGRDSVPLLEQGFDRLHAMVTRVGERRALAMPEAMIAEFEARARGTTTLVEADAASPVAAAPEATPSAGASEPARVEAPVARPGLSAPVGSDTRVDDDDEIMVRAPQEQVRIRADLLDRLVNYAGEVAIYRARLEQQLGAFRGAIAEMAQTNTRMRDQLRRLEIETEAQIVARYQREADSGEPAFDPLELDRFSTLQQLSRALSESAADHGSLQQTLDDLTRQYETLLLQQSRVSSELQEGLMRTRMVPIDGLLPRLRRVVRQASGELGKHVQLKLDGSQGELDRNVLERMTAPLEHMLRNAVAHGLETPEARRKAGKPEEGSIRIAVRREGSEVVLVVSDDGSGLNREAIRKRGLERGLIREGAVLGDSDLDMLILEPGFSTASEVSRLAGRGVGMDVVASEVHQLGGTLDIRSKPGKGVTFTLRLPQTLAVTQAVFVKIGETSFAVPIASVRGVGRISREALEGPSPSYEYGGEDYVVHDLGQLIGHAPAKAEGQLQMPVLLIRSGDLRAAVCVDQVVGNREIVVKSVGPQVASVPGIFGATIMGDGRVVVILDVAPLVRRRAAMPDDAAVEPMQSHEPRRVPLVMVVDDSVTMRKVSGRVLERHGFEVATAKDGIDALERMAEVVPDLMLLDIEMPRMDGYELATEMKADSRLRDVPIVMITSRTGDKHRQRALEIGVNRYLGKPYQEPELMRNVYELLGIEQEND
ncbi:Hpt domain-containing protein [Lysobacter spongiae]|uniref:Chemotaxis protein CheA n=2 Tax=Marilutibacter spongiae TaxID=2025720 RepID=A0A7W3TIZ1_9GAMM|nr:Hpt domain-containing protein [Lysobacter spongiae]